MSAERYIDLDRQYIEANSIQKFVRHRVIFGSCRHLEDSEHSNLREEVANGFSIHPNQVTVVGSTKLGYSMAPEKKFKPFGSGSDIDIAIVESGLFDQYWEELHNLKETAISWPEFGQFRNYHFSGWMRPDKLPAAKIRNEWFDFFQRLQKRGIGGGAPLRAALYKSWYFLEKYQSKGVSVCYHEA